MRKSPHEAVSRANRFAGPLAYAQDDIPGIIGRAESKDWSYGLYLAAGQRKM